jgi:putative chitinase
MVDIMPASNGRVITYAPLLRTAMEEFRIDTPRRAAAFIAQVAHETGQLRYVKELGSKSKPAGSQYEGRRDLGNTEPGDGVRFPGRGLLQATGRDMHYRVGVALGVDLIARPERLEEPELAARSAGWIWTVEKDLNPLADVDRFGAITRRINGGFNGLDDRISFWLRARQLLEVKPL